MTLRDWMAGQAMAGFTRGRDSEMFNEQTTAWYARVAYQLADAMLEARVREKETAVKPPTMSKPPWNAGAMLH